MSEDQTNDPDLTVSRTVSIGYTLPPMHDPETGLMVERDWILVEELILNVVVGVVQVLEGTVDGQGSGPTDEEGH